MKFQIKYSNSSDLRFGSSLPPVIILKTLDVILPEIASPLNFDENQLLGSDILDAVCGADRNVDDSSRWNSDFAAIERDLCRSRHNHPMFGTTGVLLVAQSLLRMDFDALHFIVLGFVQNREITPGPFLVCHWSEDILGA